MPIIRAIAGVLIGATIGFFLLAYADRDISLRSQIMAGLAHVLPGIIAGILAGRYLLLVGFLAGTLSWLSLVAPYAVIYHYKADDLWLNLINGAVLYGVPSAAGAFGAGYVRNCMWPSKRLLNPDGTEGPPG